MTISNHIIGLRDLTSSRALLAGLTACGLPAASMAQNAIELDTVVITASGFEQTVTEAPASITVVTAEDLEKGSFTSLSDALREVQGVVTTGISNEQDIYIRGLPGQYTMILVDGKRQGTRDARTNGNAGYEQGFIPPISAIERIEVVRGPMSSLYGSDAMGGVINIITKPVADEWTGEIKVETTLPQESGFESSRQLSFYAAGPIVADKLGLQIWGRKFDQDASSIADGPTGSDDYDLTGRLTWTPDDQNEIQLEAGKTRLTSQEFSDRRYQDNDRIHWSLTHKGDYAGLQTELSFSQEIGERTTFNRSAPGDPYIEDRRSPEVRNSVLDAKGTTSFEWNGSHQLVFGGQFIRTTLRDQNPGRQAALPVEARYDERFSLDQWALYAEDEWRLRDDFALTLGLRYSDHDFYGGEITPRIYAVWNASQQLTIKGGISAGFKAPEIRSISDGYAYTTGGGNCANTATCGVILGNPDLKPEETTNFELSGIYEADIYSLSATVFHTNFKNKLQQINTGELWTDGPTYKDSSGVDRHRLIYQNFNVDKARISGLELTGDWDISPSLSARASYTYTRSKQRSGKYKGFPLARTPEHMASLRLDYMTPVEGLDLWGTANYHGTEIASGLRIGSDGSEVTINGETGRKYAAYTTVDLGANYRINDHATLGAAIYNVLDKEIRQAEFRTVEEGRRLWVGLTASF